MPKKTNKKTSPKKSVKMQNKQSNKQIVNVKVELHNKKSPKRKTPSKPEVGVAQRVHTVYTSSPISRNVNSDFAINQHHKNMMSEASHLQQTSPVSSHSLINDFASRISLHTPSIQTPSLASSISTQTQSIPLLSSEIEKPYGVLPPYDEGGSNAGGGRKNFPHKPLPFRERILNDVEKAYNRFENNQRKLEREQRKIDREQRQFHKQLEKEKKKREKEYEIEQRIIDKRLQEEAKGQHRQQQLMRSWLKPPRHSSGYDNPVGKEIKRDYSS